MNVSLIKAVVSAAAYPLLPIRVLKVVNSLRVPLFTNAKKLERPETVLRHDHQVSKEAGACLNHSNLSVCNSNQPVFDANKQNIKSITALYFVQFNSLRNSYNASVFFSYDHYYCYFSYFLHNKLSNIKN